MFLAAIWSATMAFIASIDDLVHSTRNHATFIGAFFSLAIVFLAGVLTVGFWKVMKE
jgi:hypothetical protein